MTICLTRKISSIGVPSQAVMLDFNTTTDKQGRFKFDRVDPGTKMIGTKIRHNVWQGAYSEIPSYLQTIDVLPGETVRCDLGGKGRPIAGKLLPPKNLKAEFEWTDSLAFLYAKLPETTETKQDLTPVIGKDSTIRAPMTTYKIGVVRLAKSEYDRAPRATRIDRKGNFRFDDIPAGEYKLSVWLASPSKGLSRHNPPLAKLEHKFSVAKMPGGRSDETQDLGTLTLQNMPKNRPVSSFNLSDTSTIPVSGKVLTPKGKVAQKATVVVCSPRHYTKISSGGVLSTSSERTSTDSQGRFDIAVQRGDYGLIAVHETGVGYVPLEKLSNSKSIQLQAWARIEARLMIGKKPLANEIVSIQHVTMRDQLHPVIALDYREKTDEHGHFVFEKVVPGEGLVVHLAVDKRGERMEWMLAHISETTFTAGKTTQVELGRRGQPVTGRLAMNPPDHVALDWSQATVSLREVPLFPKRPWPNGINPDRDRKAALRWLTIQKTSAAGNRDQHNNKPSKSLHVNQVTVKVNSDGSFKIEHIPAGKYVLTARLHAIPSRKDDIPGKKISALVRNFVVPKMPDESTGEPFDLGELLMKFEAELPYNRNDRSAPAVPR